MIALLLLFQPFRPSWIVKRWKALQQKYYSLYNGSAVGLVFDSDLVFQTRLFTVITDPKILQCSYSSQ